MGFLCRQGRIRMEVVVGLLILIGAMLEGTEGLKCYESNGKEKGKSVTCPSASLLCLKTLKGNTVLGRACGNLVNLPCFQRTFGRNACSNVVRDEAKWKKCLEGYVRTSPQHAAPTIQDIIVDQTSQNSRQSSPHPDTDTVCWCTTNLCNPAGRSTPNAQVILAVLVAASLYAFNVGLGCL